MNHRRNAIIIGIFYILAAVSAVIAVILYEPIMESTWYEVTVNGQRNSVLMGVLNDLLLVITAVGTTVMLAPYLRKISQHLSLAYFSFRYMEAVFISIGIVAVLALVSLGDAFAEGVVTNSEILQPSGILLQGIHRWVMVLGPNLMLGVNTFIYSYLLIQSKLVPKPLATFGMIVSVMVFVAGTLDLLGVIDPWSIVKGLAALPLGVYEISLAIYLIAKGFQSEGIELFEK